jgi:hypothetical protein
MAATVASAPAGSGTAATTAATSTAGGPKPQANGKPAPPKPHK